MAIDPKAAKRAVCGFPITLLANAKTIGMTMAARAAVFSEARPGSLSGKCGNDAWMLCATRRTGRHDAARQVRRATASDHKVGASEERAPQSPRRHRGRRVLCNDRRRGSDG